MDAPGSAAAGAGDARTSRTVLAVLLTELVVIGAAGNQWVTVRVARSINARENETVRNLKVALLTYNWRFSAQADDRQHIWLGQVLLVLATLVLSCALVGALVRGPITFWRALLASWTAVVFATMVAAYARGLVNDAAGSGGSRVTRAVFGPLGPNTFTVFAALVLGLLVGIVAGWVATASRPRPTAAPSRPADADETHDPAEPPYAVPEQPPPFFGEPRSAKEPTSHVAPRPDDVH